MEGASVSDVAAHLEIALPSVSRLIDGLVEALHAAQQVAQAMRALQGAFVIGTGVGGDALKVGKWSCAEERP